MIKELSLENQEKIKDGIKIMPCPDCGHDLSINQQSLFSGGKGIAYRCIKDRCRGIAGTVQLSWREVILRMLKSKIVAIIMTFIMLSSGYIVTNMPSFFGSPGQALEQLHEELTYGYGCKNDNETEIIKCIKEASNKFKKFGELYPLLKSRGCSNDNEIIKCIERAFIKLKTYENDETWLFEHNSPLVTYAYFSGKLLGIKDRSDYHWANYRKWETYQESIEKTTPIKKGVLDNIAQITHHNKPPPSIKTAKSRGLLKGGYNVNSIFDRFYPFNSENIYREYAVPTPGESAHNQMLASQYKKEAGMKKK